MATVRRRVLVGAVAAMIPAAVTIVALQGGSVRGVADIPGPEVPEASEVDWIGRLEAVRDELTSARGAFFSGTLVDVTETDGVGLASTLVVENVIALWRATGPGETDPGSVTVEVVTLPDLDRAAMAELELPADIDFALDADGSLRLLGLVDPGADGVLYVDLPDSASGPMFLEPAGDLLIDHGYIAPRIADACNPSGAMEFSDHRSAILGVLSTSAGETIDPYAVAAALVEEAPEFRDPVTGASVEAAVNDVGRQLLGGVEAAEVVVRGQVPLQVQLPKSSLLDVAVFVGSDSGSVLGFIHRDPEVVGGRASDEELTVMIEISPPAGVEDVMVYVRDADNDFTCSTPDESLLATIPNEAFGDSLRARLDLTSGAVELVAGF